MAWRSLSSSIQAWLLLATAVTLPNDARAGEWPQWRGPSRDGIAAAPAPASWPEKLERSWSVEVGEGHSSPVVSGERVFAFARRGEEEVLAAFDLATGKELWKSAYVAPYTMNSAAIPHGKGPKSTPAVAAGAICSLGIAGTLSCLDAESGAAHFRHDLRQRFRTTSPEYGAATSPLLLDGLLVVFVGGPEGGSLSAFEIDDGSEVWSWSGDGPAYASPILAELDGVRQVITQSQTRLVSVEATTGKLLWSVPFTTEYDQNSVSPVQAGRRIVFSGLDRGIFALAPRKSGDDWSAPELWNNRELPLFLSTPVVKGDLLFGLSHRRRGQIFCLDVRNGVPRWTSEGRDGENAALVLAGEFLLVLDDGGELRVLSANGDGMTTVARYTVADSATWAHPAFLGDRLLVKDRSSLTLWKIPATP
jgi:outer membrane protein assembly factor BamB